MHIPSFSNYQISTQQRYAKGDSNYLGDKKQRIAIARTILKNPPILLLDEATSALDSESEKLVQDALVKAMQGKAVILIAHMMSTIIHADMIAIVENGQVIETGTHRSLLETSKVYGQLFRMQNINTASNSRTAESEESASTHQQLLSADLDQHKERGEPNKHLCKPPLQEDQKGRKEASPFFIIWFGLEHKDLVKTAIGSIAAAFSGISKPFFGYLIITVGVTYYKKDANRTPFTIHTHLAALLLRSSMREGSDKPQASFIFSMV